ncbi:Oidioi.mRNA.OKI2018_I69.chr1.g2377.t1.cds [Oikopleura dioica]|uniref:Nuclear pore protein n=1 Tax=Oikopleura dioica TaxID=34765 RepID=A0ABN7SX96_OIKDI|nr:Oidioi.mRNA.OKI2018_I69.chr1.g2377.t1.cds [Oikopleura dioica]
MEFDNGLDALLQKSEELTANLNDGTDLPRVRRNLGQILDAGKRLWSKTAAHGTDAQQVKAALFLGQKGLEIADVPDRLKNLATTRNLEPLNPVVHTDIEGFLRNEHENAILSVIEEQKQKTFEEVTNRHWETRLAEWDTEKGRILNALLGSDDSLNISILPSKKSKLRDDTKVIAGKRSLLDDNEMLYAQQIHRYNEMVVQGIKPDSLIKFCQSAVERMNSQSLVAIWNMIWELVGHIRVPSGKTPAQLRTDTEIQMALINASRAHLENEYFNFIQETVNSNLRDANRGAMPGTEQLIRSFLQVRKYNYQATEDGDVWAMIYYCLRCGQTRTAVEIARKSSQIVGEFLPSLVDWVESPDRLLGPNQESKIKIQFRRSVRACTDPFKRAVFCIVGKCDTDIHEDVIQKTDDYLWMKLSQVVVGKTGDGYESIEKFQRDILEEYGEAHFQADQSPLLYFNVLVLTGQFEAAIEFLARLNLATLVMTFTRKFESTDPQEALQYFYFLRDIRLPGASDSLFISCVSGLVRESREFGTLLGRIDPQTGQKKSGAIDKFHADTKKLIERVARDCEERGLFEDAVGLYDLGGFHDKVVDLLSELISQVLADADKPQSDRNRLKIQAQEIAQRYRNQNVEIQRQSADTFHLLLDLMTYFDAYHGKQLDFALDTIRQLDLLPLDGMNQSRDQIQSKPQFGDQSAHLSQLAEIKSLAKALIMFAGMVPYRLPGDTNMRLVQAEVKMN